MFFIAREQFDDLIFIIFNLFLFTFISFIGPTYPPWTDCQASWESRGSLPDCYRGAKEAKIPQTHHFDHPSPSCC